MGQAASMCRFRGCRYKNKNKAQNTNNNGGSCSPPPTLSSSPTATGLHLRSIEEPSAVTTTHHHHHHHHQTHNSCRMPAEQGGTGYGSETSLLGSRTGVPLPLQNAAHNPLATTHHKGYDAEHARMEAWMDENQEFVQDYFIRKATRQVVDAWMVSHATSAGNDMSAISPTHANGPNSSTSRGGSGATTPVRKISAHEFERGGLLKPIVNTIDGTPTFLSIGTQNDCSTNIGNNSSNGSNSSSSNNASSNANGMLANAGGTGGGAGGGGINFSGGIIGSYSIGSVSSTVAASTAAGGICGGGVSIAGCSSSSSCGNLNYPHHHHHHNYHHNHQTGGTVGSIHHNFHYRPQRLSRNELKQLDEKELIFELVKDICNELEVRTLCHKILQNVSMLLNADRGSLFLVQGRCNGPEGQKKCLVSKLFDVCPRSTVEEMEQQGEVRVPWGTGIAGHVAESGAPVNIPDAYKDERFNCEIDTLTGYRTKTLLCMPIKDSSGDVIGVAQVINKLNGECFSENDEKVFASYLQFCGIGLRNAQLYEKSQLEIKRNQVLLDLARMIFEEQSTIEHMVFRILTHMQGLIQCQRVQILLVHEATKGSFSRVFDFEANDWSEEDSNSRTSPYESRFPINVGITGYVATTGETVNIPNAYADDRFDPSVDDNLTFKHKSILCMAIKNSLGQIIGVIQLVNKFDDLSFTKNDENFVEAFAIFCGMGIHNTHMYEKAIVAMAKQSVTLEVLSYHASATMDEAHRLRRLRVPSAAHFCLHDFKFDDIHFEDDDTLKACLRMFLDLDFVERFHIDYEVLCRWLLSVKKNYRNVTYHNWRHAFNVAQMMFAILTATQWWKIFGEIECLALIIGCLCHDLDHRGTNNSFQIKASSPLAQLYSTSTMEHHHFDQCLMILNSPGNQILGNLSSDDYCRVIKVLEDAILSTDLAVYFRKRGPFLESVQAEPMSYWIDEEPRALLRAMSMTVCDLSAITKPWEIEKRVADLVSSEFFEQGDMEKQELNITPIDIMNREKEDELPMMQVNFIESICLPIYEAFAHLSDKLEPLVEGVRDNRKHWIDMAQDVQDKENKLNGVLAENSCNNNNSDTETVVQNCDVENGKVKRKNSNSRSETKQEENFKQLKEDDADNDDEEDETEDGIEADDDDSEIEEEHYSNMSSCNSSLSSRVSTPPPTGEDDDSSSTSTLPSKSNTTTLNKTLKSHHKTSCKSCEHARANSMKVRKTCSLKAADEVATQLMHNGGKLHSKSTPAMEGCGSSGKNCSQQQRHHHHQHHHHHNHHHHHAVGSSVAGSTNSNSSAAESDKIPKIVGKLGNLDSLQYFACPAAVTSTTAAVAETAKCNSSNPSNTTSFNSSNTSSNSNGTASLLANGTHSNYINSNLLSRRHSVDTNGTSSIIMTPTLPSAATLCEK